MAADVFIASVFSFNPFVSLLAACLAAALWTRARSWPGVALSWLALLVGWLLADGVLFITMVEGARAQGGGDAIALVAGAVGALLLGYGLPAWTGAFVGHRVTRGTGWASAIVVAATASGAMSAFASRLG